MLRGLALIGIAVSGCTGGQPERCNGIDDNGDGRVDEGCTCTPFSTTLPVEINPMLLGLGDGWAATTPPDVSQSRTYVRLDGAGQIAAMSSLPDLVAALWLQSLAWDGSRLAYIAGDIGGDVHLALLGPDGTSLGRGPDLGLAGATGRSLVAAEDGYRAVFQRASAPVFLAVDRDGNATSQAVIGPSNAPIRPLQVVEQQGSPVVLSGYQAFSRDDVHYSIGAPWTPVRVVDDGLGAANQIAGSAASNGDTVLVVAAGHLYAYDRNAVTPVAGIPADALVLAAAWTGRSWAVVVDDPTSLDLLTLDASLAVTATESLIALAGSRTPDRVGHVAVAGDAQRIAVAFQYSGQQVIQRCR